VTHTGIKKNPLGSGGLARVNVGNDAKVSCFF
jgi:hypothetical protein